MEQTTKCAPTDSSFPHSSAHVSLSLRRIDQWQYLPNHQKHLTFDRGSFDGTKMLPSPVGNMLTSALDIFEDDEKYGFLPTFGFPFLSVFESSQFFSLVYILSRTPQPQAKHPAGNSTCDLTITCVLAREEGNS